MSRKNFLIGIGGTGARVVESIVYLCAAGLGPENLTIILVDPDKGNGNLERTVGLLAEYRRCRENVAKIVSAERFPSFTTDIVTAEHPVWGVFEGEWAKNPQHTTLRRYINYTLMKERNPQLAALVDILFTPDELETVLTEGFRGHPSIGAVVMAQEPPRISAWTPLWEALEDGNTGVNDLSVFLVGSIFGGTGAAGVPTFANGPLIKKHAKAMIRKDESKVVLGGALVLPYFSFKANPEKEAREKVYVKTEGFALATKAALAFYAEKELAFDEMYLIGDSSAPPTGEFAPGKQEQRNSPHYVEIVTAVAAFDFFRENEERGGERPKRTVFYAGRKGDVVDWNSFPLTRDPGPRRQRLLDEFKLRLITSTVLAYSYSTYGMFVLGNPDHDEAKHAAWYNQMFPRDVSGSDRDPRSASNRAALKTFDEFFRGYLHWIYRVSTPIEPQVRLINTDNLVDANGELFDWRKYPEKIGNLVSDEFDKQKDLKMQQYVSTFLNKSSVKDRDMKTGVQNFVQVLFAASDKFTKDTYAVAR